MIGNVAVRGLVAGAVFLVLIWLVLPPLLLSAHLLPGTLGWVVAWVVSLVAAVATFYGLARPSTDRTKV
jgi:hypothetical protein